MYLVISTLPHFCSILPLIKYYKNYSYGYINVILISTIFSILYHAYEEKNLTIKVLDYFCASLWFLYDIYMGYTYTNKKTIIKILLGNTVTFFININIPYNIYYPLMHSIWHLINAYKCFYVSKLIEYKIKNMAV